MANNTNSQHKRGNSNSRTIGVKTAPRGKSAHRCKQRRNPDGTFASGTSRNNHPNSRPMPSKPLSKPMKPNLRKPTRQPLPPRNPDGTFRKRKPKNVPASNKRRHTSITYSTKGFTPKMLLADKMIDTSRCSSTMRRRVLSSVAEGFTREEIILIGKHLKPIVTDKSVEVRGKKKGGYCRVKQNDGRSNSEIDFNPSAEISTIIHEFVHHLRTVDRSRTKYAKTAYPTDGKGREKTKITSNTTIHNQVSLAEETATVSETEIRLKKKTEDVSSHWSDKGEKDAKEVRDIDRGALRTDSNGNVLPDGKNLTGEKAKEHLNRNYPKTIVSQRMIGGKTALSIFHDIINKRRNRKW